MLKKEQAVFSLHSSAGKDELHGTYKTGKNKIPAGSFGEGVYEDCSGR